MSSEVVPVRAGPRARVVPPLLPIWLPLVVAAILSGGLLAWMFPPPAAGDVPPTVALSDITETSGIAFRHRVGSVPAESPTTLGGGVVCFDYDGDGDIDLFFVNGADWPWEETFAKRASRGGCALYRNDGTGRFTDVSAAAELNVELQGMAAAAGDFDNDGHPDLFVAAVGGNHLFRNRGGGRFEDITADAGVGGEENTWSTAAVWLDVNDDHRLDLVVGHYAGWPDEVGLAAAFSVALMGHSYGAPTGFVGLPPTVYLNSGDGTFAAAPGSLGLRPVDPESGLPAARLLGFTPLDANADGRLDLLCVFHTLPPMLFLRDPAGGFRAASGSRGERAEGASANLLMTGSIALLQAGGTDERFATWQAISAAVSASDVDETLSLAAKLGATILDYDGDGRLDAFTAAGLAEPTINRFGATRDFGLLPRWLWNRGDRLVPVPLDALAPTAGRGIASADLDGDGDRDFVVTQYDGPARIYRNEQRGDLPWLAVDLVATRSPREAAGARIEVHTPRRVQVRLHAPAMSLFAQSSATQHFGLVEDARVRRIVVTWPSGVRQEIRNPPINRRITITEP